MAVAITIDPTSRAVVVAGSIALTGHAASAEPRWLAEPVLAVHTLCGAFWLASFLPLLWCLRLAPGKAYLALRRFSAAATGTVVVLMVAGACLAWLQLGGALEPLWNTAYGLRLLGKLALVAGLLALAAVNRFVLTPRIVRDAADARRNLSRTLVADIALGLGVLAVTASFPFDPPPRAIAAAQRDAAEGVTIIVAARDDQATLTLLPGQPGTNRLEAWVTDASGVPVAAKEATVSTALPEAGIEPARSQAAMPRPGVYVAEELAISRAGRGCTSTCWSTISQSTPSRARSWSAITTTRIIITEAKNGDDECSEVPRNLGFEGKTPIFAIGYVYAWATSAHCSGVSWSPLPRSGHAEPTNGNVDGRPTTQGTGAAT